MKRGIHALTWNEEAAGCTTIPGCPRILFASGNFPARPRWAAVFNSRKQKLLSPGSDWLRALRQCLPEISESGFGLASSTGTLTYDLVTAYARRSRTPFLLVLSSGIDDHEAHGSPLSAAPPAVACTSEGRPCPKPVGMLCRDRLLALLADVHVILEIREGGNLSSILQELQTADPVRNRCSFRIRAGLKTRAIIELIESFPQWATTVFSAGPGARRQTGRLQPQPVKGSEPIRTSRAKSTEPEYLYHYTRASPRSVARPITMKSTSTACSTILRGSAHGAPGHPGRRILCEGRIRGSVQKLDREERSRRFVDFEASRRTGCQFESGTRRSSGGRSNLTASRCAEALSRWLAGAKADRLCEATGVYPRLADPRNGSGTSGTSRPAVYGNPNGNGAPGATLRSTPSPGAMDSSSCRGSGIAKNRRSPSTLPSPLWSWKNMVFHFPDGGGRPPPMRSG